MKEVLQLLLPTINGHDGPTTGWQRNDANGGFTVLENDGRAGMP